MITLRIDLFSDQPSPMTKVAHCIVIITFVLKKASKKHKTAHLNKGTCLNGVGRNLYGWCICLLKSLYGRNGFEESSAVQYEAPSSRPMKPSSVAPYLAEVCWAPVYSGFIRMRTSRSTKSTCLMRRQCKHMGLHCRANGLIRQITPSVNDRSVKAIPLWRLPIRLLQERTAKKDAAKLVYSDGSASEVKSKSLNCIGMRMLK